MEEPSVSSLKTAKTNLYAECNKGAVTHYAIIQIPWSEGIQLELDYAIYPEALQDEWRSWSWNGTTIFQNGDAYPADLIRLGFISFDGQKVSVRQHLPSMVRSKTPIGEPRKASLGKLSFADCQDFLLSTDFGLKRTIECKGVGLVAQDDHSRVNRAYYPVRRIVATHTVKWNYLIFKNITRRPPYDEEIKASLRELSKDQDFFSSCEINFVDILEK